jgi:hypothetical protein
MFSTGYLFTTLTTFLSVVSAVPAASDSGMEARAAVRYLYNFPDHSGSRRMQDAGILFMCQNVDFGPVCVNYPPTPNECISFFGNYALLNKHLSSIEIPRGFECTLYE